MLLTTSSPAPTNEKNNGNHNQTTAQTSSTTTVQPCPRCHALRMTLYEVPPEQLEVPKILFSDFQKALTKAHSSVGTDELQRFVTWTEEYGQEG